MTVQEREMVKDLAASERLLNKHPPLTLASKQLIADHTRSRQRNAADRIFHEADLSAHVQIGSLKPIDDHCLRG